MKDTGYYITFRDKEASAGREELIHMFGYNNKEHFDEQVRGGHLKKKIIVEQGLTETAALDACSKSLREWRESIATTSKDTKRAPKRADQIMAQLETDKGLLLIRSRPHPGSH